MTNIFLLLIAFQIKHLIADYYLQFPYMYLNKGQKTGWFKPLFDHSFVHSIGTFMIVSLYSLYVNVFFMYFWLLPLFDFVTHFITDRWKATRGRTPDQPKFWYDLGIDQMVHHIVSIIIVYILVIAI